MKHFEIVGLKVGNNIHHYNVHKDLLCGKYVEVGDLVIMWLGKINNGEAAIKVHKVELD